MSRKQEHATGPVHYPLERNLQARKPLEDRWWKSAVTQPDFASAHKWDLSFAI